jgi:hypothetical protein
LKENVLCVFLVAAEVTQASRVEFPFPEELVVESELSNLTRDSNTCSLLVLPETNGLLMTRGGNHLSTFLATFLATFLRR